MISNPTLARQFSAWATALLLTGVAAFAQVGQPAGGGAPSGQTAPGMQQPGMTSGPEDPTAQAMNDRAFLRETLQNEMAEVQLSQLAAQKASSSDVKQFSQKMVDDHTKLSNTVSQVAIQEGVKPPNGISKKDKQLVAKLGSLSGPQFDDAYIRAMVKDGKKDESSFKIEAEQAQDPAVRQIARQNEPLIANHLQMIQQIAEAHNVEGGKSKSSGF